MIFNSSIYSNYKYFSDGQFELENFHSLLIEEHLKQNLKPNELYFANEKGLLHAKKLEWDTNFFECNIARLVHFYSTGNKTLNDLLKKMNNWIMSNSINYISTRINITNTLALNKLLNSGFELISSKYLTRLKRSNVLPKIKLPNELTISNANKSQLNEILKVSENNFSDNRFLKDDFFNPKKAKELYQSWVKNELLNNPDNILVLKNSTSIIGFTIVNNLNHSANFNYGFVALIAVSGKFQKQGYGKLLLNIASDKLQKQGVEVIYANVVNTNLASLRMFQSQGFKIYSTLLELRKIIR